MKKLPEVNVNFEDLYRMLVAPICSKLMLTGIELKVFNHLSEPRSANTVAEALGTHPENTRRFLDGLAAGNLLEKNDGLYQNTALTQTFLVDGSPTFMGQMFTLTAQRCNPVLNSLSKLVKEGPPPPSPETDMSDEEMWGQFALPIANNERSGPAQQVAEIVSRLPEFPSFKKMLDLGGGPGLIGIAITASHPGMNGVIFDQPAMVKVAEAFIKEYGMDERMGVMAGDYLHDPIGEGYDLIWASATLNFTKHDMDSIVKKIYDALNMGGVFVSLSDGQTNERTKPEIMALSWLPMVLMEQDMGLDQGVIADSMLQVGFESVRSRTLDLPMGPMDLDIGRK